MLKCCFSFEIAKYFLEFGTELVHLVFKKVTGIEQKSGHVHFNTMFTTPTIIFRKVNSDSFPYKITMKVSIEGYRISHEIRLKLLWFGKL